MRSKEDAKDYRYFPDPDLPPVVISDQWIEKVRSAQPELRDEKMERYQNEYGLPAYDASILTESKAMADLFEETVKLCQKPKEASNWLMVEAMRLLKEKAMEPEEMGLSAASLAALIDMVESKEINRTIAKTVFQEMFDQDLDPRQYVKEHGLGMVADDGALRKAIEQVMEENPQSVADYKSGKTKAMGYLVGQTMKAMKGKADPASVSSMVKEMLEQM